jgi:hypothetical protein
MSTPKVQQGGEHSRCKDPEPYLCILHTPRQTVIFFKRESVFRDEA